MLLEAAVLIYRLEDDQLYAPWQVAASGYDRSTHRSDYDRIRLNLGEWSRYHNIRESFENRDENGARVGRFPSWYGKTWKEHLGHKDIEAAKDWLSGQNHTPQAAQTKAANRPSQTASAEPVPENIIPIDTAKKPEKKHWAWLSLLPLAAAFLLYMNLQKPTLEAATPTEVIAEKAEPAISPQQLSVTAFVKQRKEIAATKANRAERFHHPQIYELTWDMKLVDEPLFQASVLPNCVFLVSRVHKDMMPFGIDE